VKEAVTFVIDSRHRDLLLADEQGLDSLAADRRRRSRPRRNAGQAVTQRLDEVEVPRPELDRLDQLVWAAGGQPFATRGLLRDRSTSCVRTFDGMDRSV
jgi:hypothetical protein